MKRDAKDLLEQAMKLPPEARAAIAGTLLESLDKNIDEDSEAAWAAELKARIHELDSGAVSTVPWPEARKKIMED
ncbi:MAG TPA: addiction module protein [bacterium]|nr:addiction module protein [bacterium]